MKMAPKPPANAQEIRKYYRFATDELLIEYLYGQMFQYRNEARTAKSDASRYQDRRPLSDMGQ